MDPLSPEYHVLIPFVRASVTRIHPLRHLRLLNGRSPLNRDRSVRSLPDGQLAFRPIVYPGGPRLPPWAVASASSHSALRHRRTCSSAAFEGRGPREAFTGGGRSPCIVRSSRVALPIPEASFEAAVRRRKKRLCKRSEFLNAHATC